MAANIEIAPAVDQSTGLLATEHPEFQLRNTHDELLDAYSELVQTIDMTERVLEALDDGGRLTPQQIKSNHADRLAETYDHPVGYLSIQLLQANRWKWLHTKPEAYGAQQVQCHGLT